MTLDAIRLQIDETKLRVQRGVRRMFELHLLPGPGDTRVVDITSGDIRKAVCTLIDAGEISTGISLHMYANAMFVWAGSLR